MLSSSSDTPVQLTVSEAIGVITLNRPQSRNALTWEMYERLADICANAEVRNLRAIIITGSGGKAFSAGTDISTFQQLRSIQQAHDYEDRIDAVPDKIECCPVPTIAAIAGACTGGGAAIAACCDIRLATRDLQFGLPIARTLGNCLSVSSLSRLSTIVGAGRVKEILLTARLLSADEALAAGLVSEVLPDDASVLERARVLATAMTRLAPLTLKASKEAMRRLRISGPAADDRDLIALCYTSEDFREGVEAFLSRRPPNWNGR